MTLRYQVVYSQDDHDTVAIETDWLHYAQTMVQHLVEVCGKQVVMIIDTAEEV